MISQENSNGKPLAGMNWLEIHHRAKIPERTAFAKRLSKLNPNRIVDLGCASGLWLDLLNKYVSSDCEFIGIDCDIESLDLAANRSKNWKRKVSYIQLDIEKDFCKIPPSDLTLAFNVFPYILNLDVFIKKLSLLNPKGKLAVRQYDGASIRFGPMNTADRQKIELDLRVATENSQKFHHYDMDRTFNALKMSSYKKMDYEFELFERVSPFSNEFIPYYKETLEWTCQNLSESSSKFLKTWIEDDPEFSNKYFYEVDLVAILS